MTHTNFQIFLKISLAAMVEFFDLALRAVIDSFEIYSKNLPLKKIETNLIISEALFRVAQPQQNKKYYYYY